jgi:hypothetical protein
MIFLGKTGQGRYHKVLNPPTHPIPFSQPVRSNTLAPKKRLPVGVAAPVICKSKKKGAWQENRGKSEKSTVVGTPNPVSCLLTTAYVKVSLI